MINGFPIYDFLADDRQLTEEWLTDSGDMLDLDYNDWRVDKVRPKVTSSNFSGISNYRYEK